MIKFIKNIIEKIKKRIVFKKKLKELKKRDPFIYKH